MFLGCSRSRSTARAVKAFEIEAGNTAGSGHISPLHSPVLPGNASADGSESSGSASSSPTVVDVPEFELGPAALADKDTDADADGRGHTHLALPLSSFHYQSRCVDLFLPALCPRGYPRRTDGADAAADTGACRSSSRRCTASSAHGSTASRCVPASAVTHTRTAGLR